jgi:hypothetical protein
MKKILYIVLATIFLFCGYVFADGTFYKTKVISGNDTWTDEIPVFAGNRINVTLTPDNATTARIRLQSKLHGESSFGHTQKTWSLSAETAETNYITIYPEPENAKYRLGCNATSFTSGNGTLRIGTSYICPK